MEYTASLAETEGDPGALGGEDALLEYTASEAEGGTGALGGEDALLEYTASEAEGGTGALGGEDALLEYTASEAAAGVAGVEAAAAAAAAAARLAAFISRTFISMYSWRDTVSVSSDVPGGTYTGCVEVSLTDTGKDTGAVA